MVWSRDDRRKPKYLSLKITCLYRQKLLKSYLSTFLTWLLLNYVFKIRSPVLSKSDCRCWILGRKDVQCALSVHTQFLPIKPKYKIRTTILIKINSMLRYKNANLAPILLSALAGNALTYSLMHFTPA